MFPCCILTEYSYIFLFLSVAKVFFWQHFPPSKAVTFLPSFLPGGENFSRPFFPFPTQKRSGEEEKTPRRINISPEEGREKKDLCSPGGGGEKKKRRTEKNFLFSPFFLKFFLWGKESARWLSIFKGQGAKREKENIHGRNVWNGVGLGKTVWAAVLVKHILPFSFWGCCFFFLARSNMTQFLEMSFRT